MNYKIASLQTGTYQPGVAFAVVIGGGGSLVPSSVEQGILEGVPFLDGGNAPVPTTVGREIRVRREVSAPLTTISLAGMLWADVKYFAIRNAGGSVCSFDMGVPGLNLGAGQALVLDGGKAGVNPGLAETVGPLLTGGGTINDIAIGLAPLTTTTIEIVVVARGA